MSWSIHVTGQHAAVRQHVAAASVHGQEQGEFARTMILGCLDTVPSNGVQVTATGHHDRWASTLTVEIRSVPLALHDQATPRAEQAPAPGPERASEPEGAVA